MLLIAVAALTHKSLAGLDIAVITVYFLIIFAIGFYFARKEKNTTDYFCSPAGTWDGSRFGASLLVSNIWTEHFIGLARNGRQFRTGGRTLQWLAS